MKNQLADEGLREDLISNDELRSQSEELIDSLVGNLSSENFTDINSDEWNPVIEILGGIAITRARQGFSPRETGNFVFSLKEALIETLQDSLKDDPATLLTETLKVSRLMDSLAVVTFETFIKGREDVILRQTDEIAEISTPVNARMAVPISSQPICHRAPVAPVKRALNSWMNSAPVDAGKHCTLSGPRHPASANTRAHASAIRCGSASSSREIERAL